MEPLESTRALSKAELSIRPAKEEQRAEKRKPTACPKGVGKRPDSKPPGPGLETHTEAGWHSLESLRDRDREVRRPCRSPQTPLAQETTLSEGPGRDGSADLPGHSSCSGCTERTG